MTDKPADVVCEGDVCRRVTPEEASVSSAAVSVETVPEIFKLLGSSLLQGKDGAKVPLSSITGPNKVLALYFSAHWCPPCRKFTPVLKTAYTEFKERHARAADWEIVFVSSDRDNASFDTYFEEMPWLALPFEEREAKAELNTLFKVRGIPALLIIDGETGELINQQGREALGEDPQCENFPWRPKTFQQIMEGATLVQPDAALDAVPISALEQLANKVTLLYFSASWCPPCRNFTPKLVAAVKALKEAGRNLEAVFVTGDRGESAWKEYHSHMNFPALPFSDEKRRSELDMLFEVEGIPTLIVLDEQFNIITTEGVGAVGKDPTGAKFPWRPQPLEELNDDNVSRINSGPALVLIVAPGEDVDTDGVEAFARRVLEPVANATCSASADKKWSFFWAKEGDGMAERVASFVCGEKEEAPTDKPPTHRILLVDVPQQVSWDLGALGVETSEAGLAAAVADFKAGKLGKGRPLGGGDE